MKWLRAVLVVAYPFIVFGGLQVLPPRVLALAIGAALLLRAAGGDWRRSDLRRLLAPALGILALVLWAAWSDDPRVLLFVPAGVSLVLLSSFGRSLRDGPTLIETFARAQHGPLSPARVRHCRAVTWVWCGFFLGNAAVVVGLALAGDLAWWTLYTGLLSYLVMGLLFAGELAVRAWRFGLGPDAPPASPLAADTERTA